MKKSTNLLAIQFRLSFAVFGFFVLFTFLRNDALAHHCGECESHTPTPTATATATPTPTPTATATATATPTGFNFPSCVNYLGIPGDKAHHTSGWHQIVGGQLMFGSDDVYRLGNGNYLQCFCPAEGDNGIQTNWLRTNDPIVGWFFEYGAQWNLGNYWYAAQNVEFSCRPQASPTPTPTATATPFDICPNIDGIQSTVPEGWYNLNPPGIGVCRQFQYGGPESSHQENPGSPAIGGYGTGGQILGASTMATAGTFEENLYLTIAALGLMLFFIGMKQLNQKRS